MEDRQSIIGFTEAELGFFLALLMLALVVAASDSASAADTAAAEGRESIARAEHEATRANERAAAAESLVVASRGQISKLKDSINTLTRPGTPSCIEKRVASAPVADLVVLSASEFALGGERLDASTVLARFASELAIGEQNGCRQVIRLRPRPGVDGVALLTARDRLTTRFYVPMIR